MHDLRRAGFLIILKRRCRIRTQPLHSHHKDVRCKIVDLATISSFQLPVSQENPTCLKQSRMASPTDGSFPQYCFLKFMANPPRRSAEGLKVPRARVRFCGFTTYLATRGYIKFTNTISIFKYSSTLIVVRVFVIVRSASTFRPICLALHCNSSVLLLHLRDLPAKHGCSPPRHPNIPNVEIRVKIGRRC